MVSSTIFLRISCKENEFMLYKDRPVIDNSDLLPVGGGAQREIVSPVDKHCEIRTTGSKRPNRVLGGSVWVSQRPSKKKILIRLNRHGNMYTKLIGQKEVKKKEIPHNI